MKYLIYGTICLVAVSFIFNLLGYDGFGIIISLFDWATRFILPWIAVYWFMQFVKIKKP